uniref:ABC transporter domain-containing protein n=1 Tax=Aureoumbra lagunensis TaxID=44058 RepID=A0A7S3NQ38_9STRA
MCVTRYLEDSENGRRCSKVLLEKVEDKYKAAEVDSWGADEDAHLQTACDVEFSLAYGGKLLLHNTRLFLKCGRRYGICGKNGVGKTTLMRNIANGKIEGLDPELCAIYVESHADDEGEEGELAVNKWIFQRPELEERGRHDATEADQLLRSVGFNDELLNAPVNSLSGGWRMKLSLVVAALMDADICLLDEPTNHLDHKSVDWLTQYLNTCRACCMIVSHDTSFLDAVCTDIIHYENKKLVRYHGNLSKFVAQVPEAKSYYELAESTTKYYFPIPGRLDGINTTTKAVLKLDNATFTWPGRDRPQLIDVSVKLSLGSRVVVLGANGAGKSTLIKLIVGENGPDNGDCLWRHHNLRIAYVAQHSFHHIEQHLDSSPVEYLMWRFSKVIDQELLNQRLTELKRRQAENKKDEDQTTLSRVRPLPFTFEKIMGRREKAGVLEYEIKFVDRPERQNLYIDKDRLEQVGLAREVLEFDMFVAARAAGLDLLPCTTTEFQAHLDEFGLPQEFGTYGRIRGLSGGQKVKLVLAAAMWNRPHLLILDEPTNYLDRDSLGALSNAIRDFGGGVIMISHCKEFYEPLCNETWFVANGIVEVSGEAVEKQLKVGKKKREPKSPKEPTKTTGSTNEEIKIVVPKDFWGKSLSKKDARAFEKAAKKRDIAAMRRILQVPKGKAMPGAPELGDGETS